MGVGASGYALPVLVCQTPAPMVYCDPNGTFCLDSTKLQEELDKLQPTPTLAGLQPVGTSPAAYQILGQYPINSQMKAVVIQMQRDLMVQLHDLLRKAMCEEKKDVRFLPMDSNLKQNLKACAAKAFNDFRPQLPVPALAAVQIQSTCPDVPNKEGTISVPANSNRAKQLAAVGAVGLLGAAAWTYRDEVKAGVNLVKRKARDQLCRQFALKELISVITNLSHLQDDLKETNPNNIAALQAAIKELSGIAKLNFET